MTAAHVPGLRLAGEFYAGVVAPLLAAQFPRLRYAAALLGPGSEVAGFDTARSTDHNWGPRLQVLLGDGDVRHPPYSKWLGTAFARLPGGPALAAELAAAVSAGRWPDREPPLCRAWESAAALHNQLGLTPLLDPRTRGFYDRPYRVIGAERFAAALRGAIADPRIRRLPLTGSADQFTDSTDAAGDLGLMRACAGALLATRPAAG